MNRSIALLVWLAFLSPSAMALADLSGTQIRYYRSFESRKYRPELPLGEMTLPQALEHSRRGYSLVVAHIRRDGRVASIASVHQGVTLWRSEYAFGSNGVLVGGRTVARGVTKIYRFDTRGRPLVDTWYSDKGEIIRETRY